MLPVMWCCCWLLPLVDLPVLLQRQQRAVSGTSALILRQFPCALLLHQFSPDAPEALFIVQARCHMFAPRACCYSSLFGVERPCRVLLLWWHCVALFLVACFFLHFSPSRICYCASSRIRKRRNRNQGENRPGSLYKNRN